MSASAAFGLSAGLAPPNKLLLPAEASAGLAPPNKLEPGAEVSFGLAFPNKLPPLAGASGLAGFAPPKRLPPAGASAGLAPPNRLLAPPAEDDAPPLNSELFALLLS